MEERDQEDLTNSSGSNISGLTDLDDDTDEFGKQIAQSARDEQRLNDAVRGDVRAFSKARPKPGVLAVLENFERRPVPEQYTEANKEEQWTRSPGERGNDSDPPDLNVPREWGRKGKQTNDWLRRISVTERSEETHENQERRGVQNGAHRRRSRSAQSPPAAAAADVPLPSSEFGSSPFRASLNGFTPPSRRKQNTSLEEIKQSEQEKDLSLQSFLASTPVVGRKNTALDEIKEREIASLKSRAVTTSRLDELAEKMPEVIPLRNSQSGEHLKDKQHLAHRAISNNARKASRQNNSVRVNKSDKAATLVDTRNGTAEMRLDNPTFTYKASHTEFAVETQSQFQFQRPSHQRQDSRDLLRQLARAASASPTPSRPSSQDIDEPETARRTKSEGETVQKEDDAEPQSSRLAQDADRHTSESLLDLVSSFQVVESSSRERRLALENLSRKQEQEPKQGHKSNADLSDDRMDAPLQQSSANGQLQNPLDAAKSTVPQTPIVTGAWVNTPRTARRTSQDASEINPNMDESPRPASKPSKNEAKGLLSKEPDHPKSALAALFQDARSSSPTTDDHLGESTIESLEDIIANTHDFSSLLHPDDGNNLEDNYLGNMDGASLSPAARQRALEMLALERMDQRLRAARTSIRDANRGMKRVERKVGEAADVDRDRASGACSRCGCPANANARLHHNFSFFRELWSALKSLFWIWDGKGRLRLTWLGLLSAVFLVWFVSETTLCEYYCQPLYADIDPDLGPDAPRIPYVTITVLSRPFKWLWAPLYGPIADLLTRVVDFFLGPDTQADSRDLGEGRFGIVKYGRMFESWPREDFVEVPWEYAALRAVVTEARGAASRTVAAVFEEYTERAAVWGVSGEEVL